MLSDILINIELTLREKIELNDEILKRLINLLGNYRTGMWLYPGVLKRKLGLSMVEVYDILQVLEQDGFLESYYELYCSECQKTSGIVLKTFNEIPDTFECEMCHEEKRAIENAVQIYKVIKG